MRRAEKAQRIGRVLDDLYPDPAVPLRHRDPFTLLVAVVLSAHTTDVQVNRVSPALFARARSAAGMARLSVHEVEALIRPCGLGPTKAKNIVALSELLVERHQGRVPSSFEELEALPGVGHKTAGVVRVQGFGLPAFPVDTHIHRLAARWGLSRGRNVTETERDLKRAFPQAAWGKLHLQIIFFGRQYCPARGHDPQACPICSWAMSQRRRRAGPGGGA